MELRNAGLIRSLLMFSDDCVCSLHPTFLPTGPMHLTITVCKSSISKELILCLHDIPVCYRPSDVRSIDDNAA